MRYSKTEVLRQNQEYSHINMKVFERIFFFLHLRKLEKGFLPEKMKDMVLCPQFSGFCQSECFLWVHLSFFHVLASQTYTSRYAKLLLGMNKCLNMNPIQGSFSPYAHE